MNLLGMVTFGNLEFTKLAINSIKETTQSPLDFFVVVGKPGDWETKQWLDSQEIKCIVHTENRGFPASLNDIYDYAWVQNDYQHLIVAGNDIVAFPFAVDSLIRIAETRHYEVISASQYDVKSLMAQHPETVPYFKGNTCVFEDFSAKPWEAFDEYSPIIEVADMQLLDIQNLCLYKKSVFEKIGYTDVNFYPAYYIDNDYARRIVLAQIPCCTAMNARFFHFWSRTIHQGNGGSNHKNFKNNRDYYVKKWGGDFGKETKSPPIGIFSRDDEDRTIKHWRGK